LCVGKFKEVKLRPATVKSNLWVFVNCLIENPSFDSQTKDTLTTKSSKFGSKCELDQSMLALIGKQGLLEMTQNLMRDKNKNEMKRMGGSKVTKLSGIKKLDDAYYAGGAQSSKCSIILTEGDSAKTMAISGLAVVNKHYYGAFPLKGKVLNVRDAKIDKINANQEISNILKIVGLKPGEKYTDVSKLRYGTILIMTDQDYDGSHIKGLIINFIEK